MARSARQARRSETSEVVTVPVKQMRVRRIGTSRVTFRCRPPLPCDAEHHCAAVTRTCNDASGTPSPSGALLDAGLCYV